MDDIWLFGSDPGELRRAQLELQNVSRSLGMQINSAKTEVLEEPELGEIALLIEHSAVDDALKSRSDTTPLEELIDRLLDDPARSTRTSLKFAASRMKKANSRYRVEDLVRVANQMPHAADGLSSLFKESFTHASLQDWFLEYADSSWASFEWSVAQYLHLFPSDKKPRRALRDFASATVADADTSLPLLAVAAQRLSSWDKQEARAALRDIASRTRHPQHRRVIALAALSAGERRTLVRKWLAQDDDNRVTLQMLEKANFAPPKATKVFAR